MMTLPMPHTAPSPIVTPLVTIVRAPSHAPLQMRTAQAEVLEKALEQNYDDERMSFRNLKELIRDEYMLKLSDAPFDIKDVALVLLAGACTACPKRTGAQSDMFGGEKIAADLCTDAPCYAKKVAANKAVVVEKAKAAGKDVLTAAEAKSALGGGYNSKYVKLSDTHYDGGKDKTWADELKGTKLEPQIAIDEDGKQIKVAKKEDVRAALKEAGKKAAGASALAPPTTYTTPKPETDEAKAKREAEEKLHEKIANEAVGRLVAHVEAKGLTGKLLRLVVLKVVTSGYSRGAYVRRDLTPTSHYPNEKDFEKHFGTAKDNKLLGMLFECCDEELADYRNGEAGETLAEACQLAGINLDKIETELTPKAKTTEELKAIVKKVAEAKAKKPAKKKAGKK